MHDIDPVRFLPLVHGTALELMELAGDRDQHASIEQLLRASGPGVVHRWYPGDKNPDPYGNDSVAWLVQHL